MSWVFIRELYPLRSSRYLACYFRLIEEKNTVNNGQAWTTNQWRPQRWHLALSVLPNLLFVYQFHRQHSAMTLSDPVIELMLGYYARLVNLPPVINLSAPITFFVSVYMFSLIYHRRHGFGEVLAGLVPLAPLPSSGHSGNNSGTNSSLLSHPTVQAIVSRAGERQELTRRLAAFAVVIHNLFRVFVAVIVIFFIATQYYHLNRLLLLLYLNEPDLYNGERQSYLWLKPLAVALVFELRITLEFLFMMWFAHSNILSGTLLVTSVQLVRSLLRPLEQTATATTATTRGRRRRRRRRSHFLSKALRTLVPGHVRLLLLLEQANRVIAPMLLAFFSAHLPFNTLLVGALMYGKVNRNFGALFVFWIAAFQATCTVGMHLAIASTNERFGSLAKLTMCKWPRVMKHTALRHRLRLAHYVQAFHCHRRRYGFSYTNSVGLITMRSYAQYALLTVEMLLYVRAMILTL